MSGFNEVEIVTWASTGVHWRYTATQCLGESWPQIWNQFFQPYGVVIASSVFLSFLKSSLPRFHCILITFPVIDRTKCQATDYQIRLQSGLITWTALVFLPPCADFHTHYTAVFFTMTTLVLFSLHAIFVFYFLAIVSLIFWRCYK